MAPSGVCREARFNCVCTWYKWVRLPPPGLKKMTVSEMISILSKYPSDMKLVVDSQDQGCHDLGGVKEITVAFNVRSDSGFEGPHQDFREDDLEFYTKNPMIYPECNGKNKEKALVLVAEIKRLR